MSNLVNIDVGGIAGGLFDLIDKLFTTDEERQNAKVKLIELQQKGQLAQLAVNAAEATHENIFVAGWRPFIGWVCGLAFAYNFIALPFLTFIMWAAASFYGVSLPFQQLPELDMASLLSVLGGILGLGTLRTYEKKTKSNLNRGSPGDGSLY